MATLLGTLRLWLRKLRWRGFHVSVPKSWHRSSTSEATIETDDSESTKQNARIQQDDVDEWMEICRSINTRAEMQSAQRGRLESYSTLDERLVLPRM